MLLLAAGSNNGSLMEFRKRVNTGLFHCYRFLLAPNARSNLFTVMLALGMHHLGTTRAQHIHLSYTETEMVLHHTIPWRMGRSIQIKLGAGLGQPGEGCRQSSPWLLCSCRGEKKQSRFKAKAKKKKAKQIQKSVQRVITLQ